MYEAEIRIRYPTPSFARSVRDALGPDDMVKGGSAKIVSKAREHLLSVHIEEAERVETLQATVEDIFRCIHAAETSLMKLAVNKSC